jgi:hypothetical protein
VDSASQMDGFPLMGNAVRTRYSNKRVSQRNCSFRDYTHDTADDRFTSE